MADEAGKAKKTVWILGSGFSRDLGGPLLDELLSDSAFVDLRTVYPHVAGKPEFVQAYQIFRHGQRSHMWPDAEAFLDRLDVASREPGSNAALQVCEVMQSQGLDMVKPVTREAQEKIMALSSEARRFVALQCFEFTKSYGKSSETWQAYRDWFTKIFHSVGKHAI